MQVPRALKVARYGVLHVVSLQKTFATYPFKVPTEVGDVTGDLIGDVTGDVTGNVTGDVTGDVPGDVPSTKEYNALLEED